MLLYNENAYRNISLLPNSSPKCPQLEPLYPLVYFFQSGADKVRGSNLNKYYPLQEEAELLVLLFESTNAMGEVPELIIIDFFR